DHQFAGLRDAANVALEEHCRRSMLAHQRRPGYAGTRPEPLAPIDRTGYRAAGTAEISLDLAGRRGLSPGGDARKLHFRPLAYGRQPDIDDLDRLLRRMVRVA